MNAALKPDRTLTQRGTVSDSLVLRPLFATVGFAAFTLLVYVAGPIPWPHTSPMLLAFVVLCFWGALAGAYLITVRLRQAPWRNTKPIDVRKLVVAGFLFNAISFPFAVWAYTGGSVADLSLSLESQGAIYLDRVRFSRDADLSGLRLLAVLIRTLSSPVLFAGLILGMRHVRQLNRPARVALGLSVLLQVAFSFGRGTDKEIVDLCIFGVVAAMATAEISFRRVGRVLFRMTVVVGAFLYLFAVRRSARIGEPSRCVQVANDCLTPSSSRIEGLMGRDVALAYERISGYVSQGYYGLELGLSQNYSWTAGRASVRQLGSVIPAPGGEVPTFAENLLASNWDPGARWSTIFAQLVSDTTIFLLPVLAAVVGVVLCRCWRRALRGDLGAYVVSTYLILQLFYSSTNIQLTGSSDTFLTVLTWTSLTLFFRHRPLTALAKPDAVSQVPTQGVDSLTVEAPSGPLSATMQATAEP